MLEWCRLNDILIYFRKKEENSAVKSCTSTVVSNKRGKVLQYKPIYDCMEEMMPLFVGFK